MLVYLDQKVWSSFVRKHEDSLRLLDALRPLVEQGKLLCPVALPHVEETAAWPDRRQRATAIALMVELSQGVCWRNYFECAAAEGRGQKLDLTAGPLEMLTGGGDLDRVPDLVRLIAERGIEDGLRQFMLAAPRSAAIKRISRDFVEVMTDAIETRRFQRSSEPDPDRASGPLNAVWAEMCRDRVSDPNRAVKPGDIMDMVHMAHAAMADFALLDRAHANRAMRMKHWRGWVGYEPDALVVALRTR